MCLCFLMLYTTQMVWLPPYLLSSFLLQVHPPNLLSIWGVISECVIVHPPTWPLRVVPLSERFLQPLSANLSVPSSGRPHLPLIQSRCPVRIPRTFSAEHLLQL